MRRQSGWWLGACLVVGIAVPWGDAIGQVEPPHPPEPGRELTSLRGKLPPAPPAAVMSTLVQDPRWLVVLGKALFWDRDLGNEGQACATCHFHAGADPRRNNQLSPGLRQEPLADTTFGSIAPTPVLGQMGAGGPAGPNLKLRTQDFPFHKLADVDDRESAVQFDTNDVASSHGVTNGLFLNMVRRFGTRGRLIDVCQFGSDGVFTISTPTGSKAVRKVEPRNTPTVINAAFNLRNFWDGRANNTFNGVDVFGRRDILKTPSVASPIARIIVDPPGTTPPRTEFIEIVNSSLASQAVGPPRSDQEMACSGRAFAVIGQRLMAQKALRAQKIAPDDSVFGLPNAPQQIINTSGVGLTLRYRELVSRAFKPRLRSATGTYQVNAVTGEISASAAGFRQDEWNFPLFFGLAIQAYESTLISDDSPFDRWKDATSPDPNALTAQEQRGFAIFNGNQDPDVDAIPNGFCVNCHGGPLFSNATEVRENGNLNGVVERMLMGDNGVAIYDDGFYNIGVRPSFEDIGVGGNDPYGNPLSFAKQFANRIRNGTPLVDRFNVDPCDFEVPFVGTHGDPTTGCSGLPPAGTNERIAVDGAFKTPTLRNVGLTPPYFHNGGQLSLEQVVQFYNRGGDRRSVSAPDGDTTGTSPLGRDRNGDGKIFPRMGGSNLDPDIRDLNLSTADQAALVAFLKTLTDNRVACHKAPFDHPELVVANGHRTSDNDPGPDGKADDFRLRTPAVGANGLPANRCGPNTGNLLNYTLVGTVVERMAGIPPGP